MRQILNATVIGIVLASAAGLASCESSRSPATPSRTEAARTAALDLADAGPVPTVAWQCMAAGPSWQAADCPARHTALRLTTQAAALTTPGSPTNLSGGVSAARVTLTWQAPIGGDPPTSYVIEAGSSTGRTDLANFDTGTSVPGLVVDNVPAGTYFIRVRAKNSAGVSGPSNEIALIVVGASGCPPAAPTDLVATASGFSVTLRWTAPGGACAPTGYIIEAGSTPGASNLANFNTGTTAASYVANGVGAGTYYVRVRGTNAAGTSAASNEATLVVSAGGCSAPPAAPSLLTGSVSGSTVSLAWTTASGATSYIVEAGTGPGLSNITVSDQGLATTLTANAGNGTYYIRVRAANACGTSAPTNEIVLTVGSAGTCTFSVSPATQTIANAGGSATVTVTAAAGCAWTAVSNSAFITVNGGASGSGSGTVTYSVAANPGSTSRTGTLTIAGQTITVTQGGVQAACTYAVSPNSVSFDATGGNATITVTTSAQTCAWTAQSLAGYIFVTSSTSGTGNGAVTIAIQANGGTSSRGDSVVIGGQTVRVNEDAPLPRLAASGGCSSGGQSLQEDTTLQFINTTNNDLTVQENNSGGQAVQTRTVAKNSGINQTTKVGTVWAVFSGANCLGSYTAASGGRSIVQ